MAMTLINSGTRHTQQKFVAFELFKLDGTYIKKICSKKRDQAMTFEDVEVPRGYLIRIPRRTQSGDYSHSVHLDNWDAVVAAGFGYGDEPEVGDVIGEVPLVDADGEETGREALVLRRDPANKRKVNANA